MKTPSTLSLALVMALVFCGPVVFSAPPARAGDSWDCFWSLEGYSECGNFGPSSYLLQEPEIPGTASGL